MYTKKKRSYEQIVGGRPSNFRKIIQCENEKMKKKKIVMIVPIFAKSVTKANINGAAQWHETYSLCVIWQHHYEMEMLESSVCTPKCDVNNAVYEIGRMKIDI